MPESHLSGHRPNGTADRPVGGRHARPRWAATRDGVIFTYWRESGIQEYVNDPHIHVEVNLFRDAAARTMLASTFGLVADLPTRVTTGCGVRVSLAMTSPRPEKVTCLACREHAARWHSRAAESAAELHRGGSIDRHRDLARRFAER